MVNSSFIIASIVRAPFNMFCPIVDLLFKYGTNGVYLFGTVYFMATFCIKEDATFEKASKNNL